MHDKYMLMGKKGGTEKGITGRPHLIKQTRSLGVAESCFLRARCKRTFIPACRISG